MKKITNIGMAALVAMGMLGTSCNKAESPEIETPETQKENIVTLTTTVGFAADDTKALTGTGVKTFGAGDQMAVIYKNTSGGTVKAVGTLTSGAGTKSGTFTFTLTNPDKAQNVTYIYPAAMAGSTGVDYTKLNSQSSGTLTDLGSKYDLCTKSGAWDGNNLPTLTLENQLAILAINLKNSTDITSTITGMTISDGTNTYAVSRSAAAGPIYVAILPVASQNITVTATDGKKNYAKTLTDKTYAAGNGYNVTWNMTDASVVNLEGVSEGAEINVSNGKTITGTLTDEDGYLTYATITIEDGAIVTLKDVGINPGGEPSLGSGIGITCDGNATIILEGTNTVNGFDRFGIKVKSGKTLTILGTGTLNASGYNTFSGIGGEGNIVINGGNITATGGSDGGAGIGGGNNASCGNIVINSGGTITATGGNKAAGIGSGFEGTCGNITISGGTINATGGSDGSQYYGAGIGSGAHCSIDNTISITITSGVVKVTATRGGDGGGCKFIGVGSVCSNGPTLTIDGVADATTSSTFPNFNSSVSGNTWTLTHK